MRSFTQWLVMGAFLMVVSCCRPADKEAPLAANERVDGPAPPEAQGEEPADQRHLSRSGTRGRLRPPETHGKEPADQTLFIIERSKNANVVRYDAQFIDDGSLDPEQPVIAYWVLHAEDGRRAQLNWIQWQKAYGFDIKASSSANAYIMNLKPLPDREVLVTGQAECARAETTIDGSRAILDRVYVQSSPGLLAPKVAYVQLFGRDAETGEERAEKIVPE